MRLLFRINWSLRRAALDGLRRRHDFAFERVGFFGCRAASLDGGLLIIAETYENVADENYVRDDKVGARINGSAIRAALQLGLTHNLGIFHVHTHEHAGVPQPSLTDLKESKRFVPDFFNVAPTMPHGTIILSKDAAFGSCWLGKDRDPEPIERIEFCGAPYRIVDVYA